MTEVEEMKNLYSQGETQEVLNAVKKLLEKKPPEYIAAEARAYAAWALYRQKNFDKARIQAELAGDNEIALRCLAAIAAYVDKDPQKVKFYAEKLPESPAKDNAKQIAARNIDDTIAKGEVIQRTVKWLRAEPLDPLNTANLMNNTARWLLEQGENIKEHVVALGFMEAAINLYGDDEKTNLHHRASAHFWKSKIMEKLFGKKAATPAARISIVLWEKQLAVDPANENFKKSLRGAYERLAELIK